MGNEGGVQGKSPVHVCVAVPPPHPDPRSPPMAAAETVKNTVEQFTTAGNVAFKDAV